MVRKVFQNYLKKLKNSTNSIFYNFCCWATLSILLDRVYSYGLVPIVRKTRTSDAHLKTWPFIKPSSKFYKFNVTFDIIIVVLCPTSPCACDDPVVIYFPTHSLTRVRQLPSGWLYSIIPFVFIIIIRLQFIFIFYSYVSFSW